MSEVRSQKSQVKIQNPRVKMPRPLVQNARTMGHPRVSLCVIERRRHLTMTFVTLSGGYDAT
jgi:hypothetical protein